MRIAPRRLEALTSLRFFAALHIVLYHFGAAAFQDAPPWCKRLQQGGTGAISFFFLMSGFVLAYNYADAFAHGQVSARSFLAQRLARVYPLYALAIALAVPLQIRAGAAPTQVWTAALLHLGGLQAWIPKLMWIGNGPGWCVSVELFFYLFFPFLAVRVFKAPLARRWFVEMAMTWLLAVAIALLPVLLHASGPLDLFLENAPPARLPELLFGMGLGKRFAARRAAASSGGSIVAVVATALLLAVESNAARIPPQLLHTLTMLPFGALIWSLAPDGWLARALAWSPLRALGETSYAVYLLQVPLFLCFGGHYDWDPPELARYLAVLLMLSGLAYALVERPAQTLLLGARLSVPARPALVASTLIVLSGLLSNDCLPARDWRGRMLGARAVSGIDERGFWGQEWNGAQPFRWTDGDAWVRVPVEGPAAPRVVELALGVADPDGSWLAIHVDGRECFTGKVSGRLERRCELPRGFAGTTLIELVSGTLVPRQRWPERSVDARRLGVRVDAITLR